jgi:hypothetical protein
MWRMVGILVEVSASVICFPVDLGDQCSLLSDRQEAQERDLVLCVYLNSKLELSSQTIEMEKKSL